jgi:hypothetical protein
MFKQLETDLKKSQMEEARRFRTNQFTVYQNEIRDLKGEKQRFEKLYDEAASRYGHEVEVSNKSITCHHKIKEA